MVFRAVKPQSAAGSLSRRAASLLSTGCRRSSSTVAPLAAGMEDPAAVMRMPPNDKRYAGHLYPLVARHSSLLDYLVGCKVGACIIEQVAFEDTTLVKVEDDLWDVGGKYGLTSLEILLEIRKAFTEKEEKDADKAVTFIEPEDLLVVKQELMAEAEEVAAEEARMAAAKPANGVERLKIVFDLTDDDDNAAVEPAAATSGQNAFMSAEDLLVIPLHLRLPAGGAGDGAGGADGVAASSEAAEDEQYHNPTAAAAVAAADGTAADGGASSGSALGSGCISLPGVAPVVQEMPPDAPCDAPGESSVAPPEKSSVAPEDSSAAEEIVEAAEASSAPEPELVAGTSGSAVPRGCGSAEAEAAAASSATASCEGAQKGEAPPAPVTDHGGVSRASEEGEASNAPAASSASAASSAPAASSASAASSTTRTRDTHTQHTRSTHMRCSC